VGPGFEFRDSCFEKQALKKKKRKEKKNTHSTA
jgi:hypothetical protein